METVLDKIKQGVLEGEQETVIAAVQEAIDTNISAERILK